MYVGSHAWAYVCVCGYIIHIIHTSMYECMHACVYIYMYLYAYIQYQSIHLGMYIAKHT